MRQCAVYLRNYFVVQLKDCWLLLVYVDEIEHYRTGHTFGVVDRNIRRGKGRSEETVFQGLKGILLGVDFRDVER